MANLVTAQCLEEAYVKSKLKGKLKYAGDSRIHLQVNWRFGHKTFIWLAKATAFKKNALQQEIVLARWCHSPLPPCLNTWNKRGHVCKHCSGP